MQWSKLKHEIEARFAEPLKGRVQIYSTRYTSGSFFLVRGWITLDGIEIASFSTPDHYNRFGHDAPELEERIAPNERKPEHAVEKGEFAKWEFVESCRLYLNLAIEDALNSTNPILKALAILDKRTGKRRLEKISEDDLHPLPKRFLALRRANSG